MRTVREPTDDVAARDQKLRRRYNTLAITVLVLANLHFLDHGLRGDRIQTHGLNPDWDHSGWPFRPEITPFNFAFLTVDGLLIVGLIFSMRNRLWAGYWLVSSIVLAGLATWVHFLSGHKSETPVVIWRSYDNPALGIPALVILSGLFAGIAVLAWHAIRTRQISGRW